ncbi:MAG: lipid II:glycine glycyltransferase FemX [Chitinispirillaceae bacterium]
MSVRIERIETASREQWLNFCENCSYSTYFHTPYWYEFLIPEGKFVPLFIQFEDGVSAVIPLVRMKKMGGFLSDTFSSPAGTYGGWISPKPLSKEHAEALLSVVQKEKNLTVRENPFDPVLSDLRLKNSREDYTYIVDLSGKKEDIYRSFTRGHKNAINKARKSGLAVREAESQKDWENYYSIYESTVKRWREKDLHIRTVYPCDLFERICSRKTEHEKLWLVCKEDVPVAGILCFYWNSHCVAWHGAACAEYFSIRPNHLLFWEVICDAARKGYAVFDFNPSGGFSGVESFKTHFGAQRRISRVMTTRTFLRGLLAKLRS